MTLKLPSRIAVPLLIHALLFVLVVTGIVGRGIVPYWTLVLLLWAAVEPASVTIPFFAAAIPLFIAIPLAPDFDNFNMWRIVSLVVFLRWFLASFSRRSLYDLLRGWLRRPLASPVATCCALLGVLALLSGVVAGDRHAWGLRLIFFLNASLVPMVAYAVASRDRDAMRRTVTAIAWAGITVITVGFVQLASTYVMDIYGFMRVWGEGIQLRQFGAFWSQIAVRVGNTWFAYFGPQLSLRMFSLFPDSHSFPVFVLLALAGLAAVGFKPLVHGVWRTRARLSVLWMPLGLLAVILSGTRGIWAASIGLPLVIIAVSWWMKRHAVPDERRTAWRYLAAWLAVFFVLFTLAWPIFVSPQFLLFGGNRDLLTGRFRSIIDFGETSNRARLEIWGATVRSIVQRPVLGVGLGNFPVVLGQDTILAKAGSSAHNIWLHIAAELGIIAVVPAVALFILTVISAYRTFLRTREAYLAWYAGWLLVAIPWVAAYLLTDAALFDERALLLFGLSVALIRASDHTS